MCRSRRFTDLPCTAQSQPRGWSDRTLPQVILHCFASVEALLNDFDVDCCACSRPAWRGVAAPPLYNTTLFDIPQAFPRCLLSP